MTRLPLAFIALAAACSPEAQAPKPSNKEAAKTAPAPEAKERLVEEKNELLEFTYGWPAEATAIPKLVASFEAEMARLRTEAFDMARDDKAGRTAELPFNGHYLSKVWKTYGNGRRLLSLGASAETFTGGAHGNMAYDGILWDRKAAAPLKPAQLFTDPARAFELLAQTFCQRLDRERAERRNEELPLQGTGFMVECPALAEQVIVPLDRDDRVFESFIVLIPPYTAGPYAEGSYEVEIELTDEVRRLIKPEYAGDF
jgi:hypothetical protein